MSSPPLSANARWLSITGRAKLQLHEPAAGAARHRERRAALGGERLLAEERVRRRLLAEIEERHQVSALAEATAVLSVNMSPSWCHGR
ncbi:hypothetical protein WMF20_38120 [Sorangium sp. So ce834]